MARNFGTRQTAQKIAYWNAEKNTPRHFSWQQTVHKVRSSATFRSVCGDAAKFFWRLGDVTLSNMSLVCAQQNCELRLEQLKGRYNGSGHFFFYQNVYTEFCFVGIPTAIFLWTSNLIFEFWLVIWFYVLQLNLIHQNNQRKTMKRQTQTTEIMRSGRKEFLNLQLKPWRLRERKTKKRVTRSILQFIHWGVTIQFITY